MIKVKQCFASFVVVGDILSYTYHKHKYEKKDLWLKKIKILIFICFYQLIEIYIQLINRQIFNVFLEKQPWIFWI